MLNDLPEDFLNPDLIVPEFRWPVSDKRMKEIMPEETWYALERAALGKDQSYE